MPQLLSVSFALLALFSVSACAAVVCNDAMNVNSNGTHILYDPTAYWNPTCTDPLAPYCSQMSAGTQCNPCIYNRFLAGDINWICDCPANYYPQPDTSSAHFGACTPFDIPGAKCAVDGDCEIYVWSSLSPGYKIVGNWFCVSGFCRPCDPNNATTYGLNRTLTCAGGSPYPLTSRQGETRTCGVDGYWISGGKITATHPPTSGMTSAAPTSTGGSSPSKRPSTFAVALAAALSYAVVALAAA